MTKLNRQDRRTLIAAVLLIVLAIACRFLGIMGFHSWALGVTRSCIYVFLFTAWGVSLYKRIMQVQVRRYLIAIAFFMVFWFAVRMMKYHFIPMGNLPDIVRLIWYAYYIPMLLIPMLTLFAAVSMGKPEDYRTPMPMHILWVPTILLIFTVLTNDLHQLVFSFPPEYAVWSDHHYNYAFAYGIVMAWMAGSAVVALGVILHKCRIPHSRKMILLPVIPFALIFVYSVLYFTASSIIEPFAGDITAVQCVLIAATFESCVQCGIIQTNTHYVELFQATTVSAQIADEDYNIRISSEGTSVVPTEILRHTETEPVMLSDGIRLSGAPIRGGHILWREDVSELLSVLNQLGDTQEELRDYGHLLEQETKQKQSRLELEEQKRLYEVVQCKVSPTMKHLDELTGQLEASKDVDEARALHCKLAVVGAYLKRRSNLVFLADRTGMIAARELFLCLNESISNLRLVGTVCALQFDVEGNISGEAAGLLYDFFEEMVERSWNVLPRLNIVVTRQKTGCHILLMLPCETDLSVLADRFPNAKIEQDEDVCYCSMTALQGGEPL